MTGIIDGEFAETKTVVHVGNGLDIDGSDLSEYVQDIRSMNGGPQIILRFQNGFGASVIQNSYSYGGSDGLWELAVTRYRNDDQDSWGLCYDTEITDDVMGRLTPQDISRTLRAIRDLDTRGRVRRQAPSEIAKRQRTSLVEEQAEISRKMGELARRMSKVSEELVLLNQTYEFEED